MGAAIKKKSVHLAVEGPVLCIVGNIFCILNVLQAFDEIVPSDHTAVNR